MDAYSIPATSGIYRIVHVATGRMYIGSAVNLQKRWREHRHYLSHKTHPNQKLQRAWDKYGSDTFIYEVIELVLFPDLLTAREQFWFDKLQPFGNKGFNIDRIAGSRLGSQVSLEAREKLRIANLGKTYSDEVKHKHSESGKRRKHSNETKEMLRVMGMGHPVSDEAREKMRQAKLGTKQSDATKAKRSASLLGRVVSEATRAKNSVSNAAYTGRMTTLIITDPNGTEYLVQGIAGFAREHALNPSALIQVAKGNAPHHKRWTARYP